MTFVHLSVSFNFGKYTWIVTELIFGIQYRMQFTMLKMMNIAFIVCLGGPQMNSNTLMVTGDNSLKYILMILHNH